jgi:hypothetical protein
MSAESESEIWRDIPIEEISVSDNIRQFMEKCNRNFLSIIRYGGGPAGRPGNDGETGATGKRGNRIHWVEADNTGSESDIFDEVAATSLVSGNMDMEDGDIVYFTNGYVGLVNLTEDSESECVPVIAEVSSIRGPQGMKGDAGDTSEVQQFAETESGDTLYFKERTRRLILSSDITSFPSNTASIGGGSELVVGEDSETIIDGGISFITGGEEKSAVRAAGDSFYVTTELDNISIESVRSAHMESDEITIGSRQTTVISAGASAMTMSSGGTSFDGQAVSFSTNTVSFSGKLQVGSGQRYTEITGQKVNSDEIETKFLTVKNIPSIGTFKVGSTGVEVGNAVSVGTDNRVSVKVPVVSTKQILADNGDGQVLLDTPKYTMMLYPSMAKVPKNWVKLDNDIEINGISEIGFGMEIPTKPKSDDGKNLFFIYKGENDITPTYYKISDYKNNIRRSISGIYIFSGEPDYADFIANMISSSNTMQDMSSHLIRDYEYVLPSNTPRPFFKLLKPATPSDTFVWIFKKS